MAKHKQSKGRPEIDGNSAFGGIEVNEPISELLGYTIAVYGLPKTGKSTFAASWPKPLFLATETRGIKAMRVPHIKIRNYHDLLSAMKLLKKKNTRNKYQSIIIDTVDLLFKYIQAFCCNKYGFDHPSDQGWAKGWERLGDEFLAIILKLFDLGYTLIFISHSKTTKITADWEEYTRIDPSMPNTARKTLFPYVDVILYMRSREKKGGRIVRSVTTKATREYEAGDRTRCLTDMEITIPRNKKDNAYSVLNTVFKKNAKKL